MGDLRSSPTEGEQFADQVYLAATRSAPLRLAAKRIKAFWPCSSKPIVVNPLPHFGTPPISPSTDFPFDLRNRRPLTPFVLRGKDCSCDHFLPSSCWRWPAPV